MQSGWGTIKQVVYALKREFPMPLTLLYEAAPEMDWDRGIEIPTFVEHKISRAILLPASFETQQVLKSLGLSKGGINIGERIIILDKGDVHKSYTLKEAKVVIEGYKWDVVEVMDLNNAGLMAVIKEIKGSPNAS